MAYDDIGEAIGRIRTTLGDTLLRQAVESDLVTIEQAAAELDGKMVDRCRSCGSPAMVRRFTTDGGRLRVCAGCGGDRTPARLG